MTPQTITLTHLPDILLVVLPEKAKEYHITQDYQGSYLCWDDGTTDFERQQFGDHGQFKFCDNPRSNWRIVSALADLTEEWCKGVARDCIDACECVTGYVNYTEGRKPFCLGTALESFHSAIRADKWYLENPYGEEPVLKKLPSELAEHLKRHGEAQSRTLDPELTLILERK